MVIVVIYLLTAKKSLILKQNTELYGYKIISIPIQDYMDMFMILVLITNAITNDKILDIHKYMQ